MDPERLHWECDDQPCRIARHPGEDVSNDDLDAWETPDPGPSGLNVWDAFDRDDEMTEPEPEYGDFWTEVDRLEDPD